MSQASAVAALDRGRMRRAARRLCMGILVLAVLVFGVGQLVLPEIAEIEIRDSMLAGAQGVKVSVSAFPAVMLLFGHADSVTVHARSMRPTGRGSLVGMLSRIAKVGRLDATVEKMQVLGLELDHVSLHKRGSSAVASAVITRSAIAAALPVGINLFGDQEGQSTLKLTAEVKVLGHVLRPAARLIASGDSLEIAPAIPVISFVHLTVFADPQLALSSIGMSTQGERYTFHISGQFA